jgi:DNA repair exonuclease SbcCD nuclease subunit
MKLLHCSDWHADHRTSGVDRFDDVAEAVAQTVKTAREEKVDLYLFTGDLCDPDDVPRALKAVGLAIQVAIELASDGIESWWLRGNHCLIENGENRSVLTPLSALGSPLVKVFDTEYEETLPGRKVTERARTAILLPYPSASCAYDAAAFVRSIVSGKDSDVALVAGHLQVEGATPGDETTEMARGRDVFFPFEACDPNWLLLAGHYHQAQVFERHGRKLHVPGSLVRLNHGEEKSEPRYTIWEI